MVVESVDQADEIVREIAKAWCRNNVTRVPGQRANGVLHPCGTRLPVDQARWCPEEAAAELGDSSKIA